MGTVYAIDRDGSEHRLPGRERASLMEILVQGGLSVEALCNGCCQCATCHIYVEEPWLSRLQRSEAMETLLLEEEAEDIVAPNSRLACQIPWQESLDGIKLRVAPEIQ